MLLLFAFLVILVVAGAGFALHMRWVVALVLFAIWLLGFVIGRGEQSGSHHLFRW
jgi:hypothetical protein